MQRAQRARRSGSSLAFCQWWRAYPFGKKAGRRRLQYSRAVQHALQARQAWVPPMAPLLASSAHMPIRTPAADATASSATASATAKLRVHRRASRAAAHSCTGGRHFGHARPRRCAARRCEPCGSLSRTAAVTQQDALRVEAAHRWMGDRRTADRVGLAYDRSSSSGWITSPKSDARATTPATKPALWISTAWRLWHNVQALGL